MKSALRILLALTTIGILTERPALAQDGTISGRVFDSEHGEALPGAKVPIPGAGIGYGPWDTRIAVGPGAEYAASGSFDVKLYLGYTYIYATRDDLGLVSELSLNPRHSAGAVLFYEGHESGLKVGFETYWTGAQRLERNPYRDVSPDYFLTGVVAEKAFRPLRIFVNFENIFDTRQTRWDPIVAGGYDEVSYRPVPIYAPLEGRVINGGVRVVL
jgi:hypothetical protein